MNVAERIDAAVHVPPRAARAAPDVEKRRLQCYLALMAGDVAALFAAFLAAGYLYLGGNGLTTATGFAEVMLPVFLTIMLYNGAYSIDALLRPWTGIARAVTALLIAGASFVLFAFYTKSSAEFSRGTLTLGLILAILAVTWIRLQLRAFVAWRAGGRIYHEIVIDDGGDPVMLPGVPVLRARDAGLAADPSDPVALDRLGDLLIGVDRVLVSCPPERRQAWALLLKGANVSGELLSEDVARLGAQGARVSHGHGCLAVSAGAMGLRARAMKRALDITSAAALLAIAAPVMLVVALAILIEDGRPVLFVQRRMGRGNRFFNIYKFRSMAAAMGDADGDVSTRRGDPRVTRVGRVIRRTSIDELPQLWNVLKGDMSMVGPRPHPLGCRAGDRLFWDIDSRYWLRHGLKPGLSGLAQVRGYRGATDVEDDLINRLQSDLEYVEGWTIWRDARIMLQTLAVIWHDRAY